MFYQHDLNEYVIKIITKKIFLTKNVSGICFARLFVKTSFNIYLFSFCSDYFQLTLWDTGGMERMSFIGSSYYRGAHAALLCYSVKNKDTFTILSQYILDIVMNAEGAKIFLCGNMADCEGDNQVTDADIENFERECGDVLSGMYKISCKDNSGVFDMFKDMARVLHQEALGKMTLRRELNVIRPGESPENDESQKKKCC